MSNLLNLIGDKIKDRIDNNCKDHNISRSERVLSVVAGGFILGIGIRKLFRSPLTAFSGITLGGALVYRGVTGHCSVKNSIEKNDVAEATIIEHRYFVK